MPHPTDPAPPTDHPDYATWLCRRVGQELRERRRALGKTAMELQRAGFLSDQAILNNESGQRNPGLGTLVRHAQMLGTSIEDVIGSVRARGAMTNDE